MENLQTELMKLKAMLVGDGFVARARVLEQFEKIEKTVSNLPKGPVRLPGRVNWNHAFCYWWGLHEETAAAQVECRSESEPQELAMYDLPIEPVLLPGRKNWDHRFCYAAGRHEDTPRGRAWCRDQIVQEAIRRAE